MVAERSIRFTVRGAPIPQGSVTAHATRRKDGTLFAAVHYQSGTKLHRWRNAISVAARAEWGEFLTYNAVRLHLIYWMKRPLTHYRTTALLVKREYVDMAHEHPPDLDKLVRATMDALTGVVYEDDKQVIELRAHKLYVPRHDYPEGLDATIYAL